MNAGSSSDLSEQAVDSPGAADAQAGGVGDSLESPAECGSASGRPSGRKTHSRSARELVWLSPNQHSRGRGLPPLRR
jgi:hypothetical protein